ncbi:hypothetical protein PTSG_05527 [Salpingoeca rosetta]|uniref:tRNA-splicing endonuclease subunit SEN34 n=1 Tax=Salpingoeca rosetta (strain ATCC 50818 / BSB-021) TaxID=946362 RepID=F2UBG7_SALR5|nr:uncharacterized protein PTSG_05527 [Salpingoeca rosetta]EGD73833.1 hypothetical protein PTSG_05527 [Salpingoeca rosetta]|eukprot:XP_004993396.1 hypothetical protein PTSG_05527 [Salpingoeca rosetta]
METKAMAHGYGAGRRRRATGHDERINIYITCGQPLIWSPEEQEVLRKQYNIVCYPIGTLPNNVTQNIFKGVPYMIDKEAVRLLLDFDKAQLWSGDDLAPLLPMDVASLQRHRLDSIMLQLDHFLYGTRGSRLHLSEDNAPKKAKRGAQDGGRTMHHDGGTGDGGDDNECDDDDDADDDGDDVQDGGDANVGTGADVDDDGDDRNEAGNASGPSEGGAEPKSRARRVVSWVLNRLDVQRWLPFPWTERGRALVQKDMDAFKALDPDREQPPTHSDDNDDKGGGNDDGDGEEKEGVRGSDSAAHSANDTSAPGQVGSSASREVVWCNARRDMGARLASCRVVVPHVAAALRHRRRPFLKRAFKFPETAEEKRHYAVYRDLVMRGYFLGPGMKFGGHYLVYPGDPYRYHSHFVAIVVDHAGPIHPLDIVAAGRLGTVVKKAPLLCSVDDDGNVHYLSLQWTGMN